MRRLILAAIAAMTLAQCVAGCAKPRDVVEAAGKGAQTGGVPGALIAAAALLLTGGGVRHVERRSMKRRHARERDELRARIAELENQAGAARARKTRVAIAGG